MTWQRFQPLNVAGVPLRIDLSWLVVAALVTWSLAGWLFPLLVPGLGASTYWWMGVSGALGLFASVVLHELAHALVARRYGVPIRGVTLFVFGGVAEMESEPAGPAAEFGVAIAGPIATLGIALGCGAAGLLGTAAGGWPAWATAVASCLAVANLLLLALNALPAFPLDGGRVLRSVLWQAHGDLRWATRVSSRIGVGFGYLLIAGGVWRAVAADDLLGGAWLLLVGFFLRNGARIAYRHMLIRRNLEGESVEHFMERDPISVSRAISVAELVEQYVYRYRYKLFPVVDDDRLLGCVTTRRVKSLPREEWDRQSVGTLVEPCTADNTVSPDTDALEALSTMSRTRSSRLLVVDRGHLVGIVALKDMLHFLALKVELESPR